MQVFNKYRKDGVGLHTFTDKADDTQYLYTQFEADFCHYVMPVFDQPDVKAPWVFKAIVPEDWIVIANDKEDESKNNEVSKKAVMDDLTACANLFG
jgi:aminopeptidase N